MKEASISILKSQLSRYLDAVKSGEEVIVTERGRPVARLTGVDAAGAPAGRASRLVREGRMRAPTHAMPDAPGAHGETKRPADPRGRSLELLLDERAEGR
jgi:prevent-host-death family protein